MKESEYRQLITPPPLALYVHLPWCIKKCPYCDFNSYNAPKGELPEKAYLSALIEDLENDLPLTWGRSIHSIFIGGGTPSLFSAESIDQLLSALHARLSISPFAEVTLEANPGTFEQAKFKDFKHAGINRLSIGIQSFQTEKLKRLGRVHGAKEALRAVEIAYQAGFDNINLDLIHGLPDQTIEDALNDLETAIEFSPTHLSWYQLTLEPNTFFAKYPPLLPPDDHLFEIQCKGFEYLADKNYERYEVSAFSKQNHQSAHNLNYWMFGDYLGIGAGAHGKITDIAENSITRFAKTRNPQDYMNRQKPFTASIVKVTNEELPLEFMMNVLRLVNGVEEHLFTERTGLSIDYIASSIQALRENQLLETDRLQTTPQGLLFLNNCLERF